MLCGCQSGRPSVQRSNGPSPSIARPYTAASWVNGPVDALTNIMSPAVATARQEDAAGGRGQRPHIGLAAPDRVPVVASGDGLEPRDGLEPLLLEDARERRAPPDDGLVGSGQQRPMDPERGLQGLHCERLSPAAV